ncbi:MAG: serine hydrolase [Clostridiales bacterium]|nr:serine hydrolase [Clostridiales bacterium]
MSGEKPLQADIKHIERARTAQSVGVSPVKVQQLIDGLTERGVDIHGLMLVRHGKVACEAWRSPVYAEAPHMAYSVSKSFLSTAIGFALDEGLMTEGTRFLDLYPEYRSRKKDERLEKLTILDLVAMTSGKKAAMTNRKELDWIQSFVDSKWECEPGGKWRYINENYYIAAAMLVRASGMSVTEYLTPRLYKPLGMKVPVWETCSKGIETGGWGLSVTTEDIAKLLLCYHNKGVFDGVQVIPRAWAVEAVKKQNDNSVTQSKPDSMAGYGYGFWRCAGMENTYRCEGVYSQYAICFEDQDACLVMTGSHANLQETLDIIWEYVPDVFIDEDLSAQGAEVSIPPKKAIYSQLRSPLEKQINGKVYKMKRKPFLNSIGFPVSVLPMPAIFFSSERGGNITDLSFDFDETELTMSWTEDGPYRNTLKASMTGGFSPSVMHFSKLDYELRSSACWRDENTLEISVFPISTVAERRLIFTFKGNKIDMYPDSVPGIDEKAKVMGETLKCILTGRYFHTWIDILVPRVKNILQPMHHGKVK